MNVKYELRMNVDEIATLNDRLCVKCSFTTHSYSGVWLLCKLTLHNRHPYSEHMTLPTQMWILAVTLVNTLRHIFVWISELQVKFYSLFHIKTKRQTI